MRFFVQSMYILHCTGFAIIVSGPSFTCNDGAMIEGSGVCDGLWQCSEAEDEANCGSN